MKCLTICQPYPELICTPQEFLPSGEVRKRVENRTWGTSYRGRLLIHAGKSRKWLRPGAFEKFPEMVFGAIVGVAELAECVSLRSHSEEDAAMLRTRYPWFFDHPHTEGPYCWILTNARLLAVPVPYTGHQGLFDVPLGFVSSLL